MNTNDIITLRGGGGMKRYLLTAFGSAVGLLTLASSGFAVNAQEIVVERGAPRTTTESLTFSKMTLHDNLTAKGENALVELTAASGAVIELAPDAGDTATLALQGRAEFVKGESAFLKTGAGTGAIRVDLSLKDDGWEWPSKRWPTIEVSDETPANADGVVPLVELKAGPFKLSNITNESAHPVEIRFAGGFMVTDAWQYRPFFAAESNPIVLRGDKDANIRLEPGWHAWYLGGFADRSVVTTGACDVLFYSRDRNAENWGRIWLDKAVAWGHSGDLIAEGVEIRTDVSDVLPHGTGTGGVVLHTTSTQIDKGFPFTAILDLNGTTQTVNSLDVSRCSYATNRNSQTAVLMFGADDMDGTLKGDVAANVKVRKLGTGTLTLDNATVTEPVLVDGGLSITGVTTIAGLGDALTPVLAKNRNIEQDENYNVMHGGTPQKVMEASGFLSATPRPLVVQKGGTLVFTNAADTALERLVSIDARGSFVKTGAGALSVRGSAACPQRFEGLVRAASGRLSLSGMGITNAFWRVTITRKAASETLTPLRLCQFGLFDADGNCINQRDNGYRWRRDVTDATNLAAGEVLISPISPGLATEGSAGNLFWGKYWALMGVMGIVENGVTNDLSEISFTFRLHLDATAPAWSYAFADSGTIPSSWTIETSPDGVNWTLADTRTGLYEKNLYDHLWYYWHLDGRWGNISGLPLTFAYANEQSSNVDVTDAMLRADAGATLDVTAVMSQPAGIQVDAAMPGGTIVGLPSLRNKTLEIVNLPAGATRSSLASVASLVTCVGGALTADDLASWRVTVNGAATRLRATMDESGHVRVVAPGFTVIIR